MRASGALGGEARHIEAGCPDRPASDRPGELGFVRRKMTRWFGPPALLQTRVIPALASLVGAFGGRRELQSVLAPATEFDYTDRDELWIDFVADVGDGFDPTYAVASTLASDLELRQDGALHRTRRGQILLMGGDQVYASASARGYADRFVGPYRAALPCTPDPHPHLFAIPGNHDWYDELNAFADVFCRSRWVGGWQTRQTRSYFALRLPHRWWVWGVDIALDELVDAPQVAFFTDVARTRLRQGDHVILVTAKPTWVHSKLRGDEAYKADPSAARNLGYVEREIVEANGAVLAVALSGDLHHYSRYERGDGARHKITCGGGGAYLYPTHHLPAEVGWPEEGTVATYGRKAVHPEASRSRRMSVGCLLFPIRNPSFAAAAGALFVLMGLIAQFALRQPGVGADAAVGQAGWRTVATALLRSPGGAVMALVLVLALVGFADAPGKPGKVVAGAAHAGAHLALVVIGIMVAARLAPDGGGFLTVFLLILGVMGGIASSFLMGLYLLVTHLVFGSHPNEVFAAQHIAGHKSFLRMRLRADGTLTIFPVALDRIPRRWVGRPDGAPGEPWFAPADEPLRPRLIEPPIAIRGPLEPPTG